MYVDVLKQFDPARYDLEEMISMRAHATSMLAVYTEMGMEAPLWLSDAYDKLNKEIKARARDALEAELREVSAREESLKTAAEKREDLATRRKRIEEKLAKASS